jgi:hypothetical protein
MKTTQPLPFVPGQVTKKCLDDAAAAMLTNKSNLGYSNETIKNRRVNAGLEALSHLPILAC